MFFVYRLCKEFSIYFKNNEIVLKKMIWLDIRLENIILIVGWVIDWGGVKVKVDRLVSRLFFILFFVRVVIVVEMVGNRFKR